MKVLATVLFFIIMALLLAFYFVKHDRGEKKPIGALWAAAGFGLLGTVLAGTIETFTVPDSLLSMSGLPLLGVALGIGVVEECSKFIPLALFIYPKRYFNEHKDGVIYFAIAGLGFGVPENILYTLKYGAGTGLTRLILTPFFHAATTALVGYYLARNKLSHRPKSAIALPLIAAIALHGLYDWGLLSQTPVLVVMSLMITLGLTTGMFLFYMKAGELDQAAGLASVGNNAFCRSCGFPNPDHSLYCTRCGKRA